MSSAGDIVFSKSFSQPTSQLASYAFPNPYVPVDFLIYDPDITKYVFYSLGPVSGSAITKLVGVTGCPLNFAQSVTISCTADYIVKTNTVPGAITLQSTHMAAVSWENSSPNSVPPNITSSEILMTMTAIAPFPLFTLGGTPVLKLVINITND